jgi:hypothetical protein
VNKRIDNLLIEKLNIAVIWESVNTKSVNTGE